MMKAGVMTSPGLTGRGSVPPRRAATTIAVPAPEQPGRIAKPMALAAGCPAMAASTMRGTMTFCASFTASPTCSGISGRSGRAGTCADAVEPRATVRAREPSSMAAVRLA
jgi:hypothetical protein